MKLSAVGALGALILTTSAAPALATGYYDAYPPGAGPGGPPPGGYCPPAPCPCPPGGPAQAPPWAYQGPAPEGDYEGPPPEADYGLYYGSGPGPDEGAGVIGPGVYYDDNGMFVDEPPYFGWGGGYGYWPGGFGRHRDRRFEDRGFEGRREGFGAERGVWMGGRIEGERPGFGAWGGRGIGFVRPAAPAPLDQAARGPVAHPAARVAHPAARAGGGRR